jgi:hypothetical protein
MSTVGASRLRLASWGNIPIGAELANLVPFSSGADTVLVAVDSLGNYSWPFVCGVQEQLNKDSLVKDAGSGAKTLESPDLTYTVIGGVASSCAPLALTMQGLTGFDGAGSSNRTLAVVSARSRFGF